MRAGFTASIVSHAAVLALGLLSLQGAEALNPPEIEAIPIELIPIEEFSNVRLGSLASEVIETNAPSAVETELPAQLAERTGNTEDDQPLPEETAKVTPAPTINTAPEPQPIPEPDPVPEPTPSPQVREILPPPTPEPEIKPVEETRIVEQAPVLAAQTPQPPAEISPVPPPANRSVDAARQRFAEAQAMERTRLEAERQARQEAERKRLAALQANPEPDQVSQIINNEQSRGATTGAGGSPTAGRTTGTAARLSQNQLEALIAKIRECWSVPPGAADAGVTVVVRFELNRDGTVSGRPEPISPVASQLEQTTALSIGRAVRNCEPYTLLQSEAYDEWRVIEAEFRARDGF